MTTMVMYGFAVMYTSLPRPSGTRWRLCLLSPPRSAELMQAWLSSRSFVDSKRRGIMRHLTCSTKPCRPLACMKS